MVEAERRPYRSALREEQARLTAQRVADAARELMLEQGYAATTVPGVARRAGVAVATVYAAWPGGKPALVKAAYDVSLAGDARAVPQGQRPEVARMIAEPDPARVLHLYAEMGAGIAARVAPLHRVLRSAAAASASPDLDAFLATTEQQRSAGARALVGHLASAGALRADLDQQRAAEAVAASTAFETWDRLTVACGWTSEEYAGWLGRVLVATLLPEPRGDGPGGDRPCAVGDGVAP